MNFWRLGWLFPLQDAFAQADRRGRNQFHECRPNTVAGTGEGWGRLFLKASLECVVIHSQRLAGLVNPMNPSHLHRQPPERIRNPRAYRTRLTPTFEPPPHALQLRRKPISLPGAHRLSSTESCPDSQLYPMPPSLSCTLAERTRIACPGVTAKTFQPTGCSESTSFATPTWCVAWRRRKSPNGPQRSLPPTHVRGTLPVADTGRIRESSAPVASRRRPPPCPGPRLFRHPASDWCEDLRRNINRRLYLRPSDSPKPVCEKLEMSKNALARTSRQVRPVLQSRSR